MSRISTRIFRWKEFDYKKSIPKEGIPDRTVLTVDFEPFEIGGCQDEDISSDMYKIRRHTGGASKEHGTQCYSYIFNVFGNGNKCFSRVTSIIYNAPISFSNEGENIFKSLEKILRKRNSELTPPLSAITIRVHRKGNLCQLTAKIVTNVIRSLNHYPMIKEGRISTLGIVETFFRNPVKGNNRVGDNIFIEAMRRHKIKLSIYNVLFANLTMLYFDVCRMYEYTFRTKAHLRIDRITVQSIETAWHYTHNHAHAVVNQLIPQFLAYGKEFGEDRQRHAQRAGYFGGNRNAVIQESNNVKHQIYAKTPTLIRFETELSGDALKTDISLFEKCPIPLGNGMYSKKRSVRGSESIPYMTEELTELICVIMDNAWHRMERVRKDALSEPYPDSNDIATWWLASRKSNDSIEDWVLILERILKPNWIVPELLPKSTQNTLRRAADRGLFIKKRGRFYIKMRRDKTSRIS